MAEAYAKIEYVEERNQRGQLQDCVFAECLDSGHVSGPVWGHGEASVKRVLALLTEEDSCGASFHMKED